MTSVRPTAVSNTMKKDTHLSNNIEKVMSRPSSGSSASSRSSSQKGKVKDKGPSKQEISQVNEELSLEVEQLTAENQLLKSILGIVIDKLVENARIKGVNVPVEVENAHVTEIPLDSLVAFTEHLTAEPPKTNSMEFRVEELETRVTHLNTELAKLLRTRLYVENGLGEILDDQDYNVEKIKLKARDLLRELSKYRINVYVCACFISRFYIYLYTMSFRSSHEPSGKYSITCTNLESFTPVDDKLHNFIIVYLQ